MNPEILRNAWIEATPRRLAIMAAVLAMILGAAWLIGDVGSSIARGPWVSVYGAAQFLAVAILVLWGARNAAEGVLGEIKDRTWDFQRLSSLSPAAMTVGKLFGPTLYVWFGGLLCLGAMVVSAVMAGPPVALRAGEFDMAAGAAVDAHYTPLRIALQAFVAQAVAVSTALLFARGAGKVGGAASVLALGAGLAAYLAAEALHGAVQAAGMTYDFEAMEANPQAMPVQVDNGLAWFGFLFKAERDAFFIASLAAFAAWAAIGVWRLMRRELQMPSTPWAFAAFAPFLALYAAGFAWADVDPEVSQLLLAVAIVYFTCHGVTLVAAFLEPKSPVGLRRLAAASRERGVAGFAAGAPAYLIGLGYAVLAAIAMAVAFSVLSHDGLERGDMRWLAVSAPLFLIRDVALVLMFHLAGDARRSAFAALITLALLYGVGGALAASVGSDVMAAVFFPTFLPVSVFSGFVGAAAALLLCHERWGRLSRAEAAR